MRHLQELVPGEAISEERFRPNLVIEADGSGFLEDRWVGQILALSDDVQLEVTSRAERCVMTTFAQGELAQAPAVLARIAASNNACFGVYATPVRMGHIRVGDEVKVARMYPDRVT